MNYRKCLQKYLMLCVCALVFLHVHAALWYFGLISYLQPYFECTPLCSVVNDIIAALHTVSVIINLLVTRALRFGYEKSNYIKARRLFRLMSFKFTMVAVCFTIALIVETGALNSPSKFRMYSVVLARFHLLIEILDVFLLIVAMVISKRNLRRELLTMKPLVAAPLDLEAEKERWQFLAPPEGHEIARYDYLVPQTPAPRKPHLGFNYLETAMQDHKRKHPLVTFRPLLNIEGHRFIN